MTRGGRGLNRSRVSNFQNKFYSKLLVEMLPRNKVKSENPNIFVTTITEISQLPPTYICLFFILQNDLSVESYPPIVATY